MVLACGTSSKLFNTEIPNWNTLYFSREQLISGLENNCFVQEMQGSLEFY